MKRRYLWIIVAAIVVIAAIVGVLMIPREATPDNPSYNEPDEYGLTGKTAISSSISPETAQLVAITYSVKEEYIGAGTLWVGAGVKNKTTDRVIEKAGVSLRIFDGKNGTGKELKKVSAEILAIGPGKTEETGFGLLPLNKLQNPKSYVVTLESIDWRGTVSSTTPPLTPPIVAAESPGQVVKNFFTAMAEGRYTDAQKYTDDPAWFAYIKGEYEKKSPGRAVRVTILKEEIDDEIGSAEVTCIFYLADGTSITSGVDIELINRKWMFP